MPAAPVSLEALATLDAIERRGSYARAAEELGKATSAVSYAVQQLEEQLGFTVYVRQGRRSVLTPAGRLLLNNGRPILAAARHLTDQATELATGWEPRLRVGLEWLVDASWAFEVINNFQKLRPTTEIDVRETVLNGGWEALSRGQIDLLVGGPGPVPGQQGLHSVTLGRVDLVLAISPLYPGARRLARCNGNDQALAGVRRVISHDTAAHSVRRDAGLSTRHGPVIYVQNIEQKTRAIMCGIGAGHLPRHRVQQALTHGELLQLPSATENAECYLAWKQANRGKALKKLANAMTAANLGAAALVTG